MLLNLILLFILFVFVEIYSYLVTKNRYSDLISNQNSFFKKSQISHRVKIKYQHIHRYTYSELENSLRPTISFNSRKRPLLFVGCSYTNTYGLSDNQLLSSKVAYLTKRTTYNRGQGGEGPQLILYQFKNKKFFTQVPDAEFIIYTFIYDHLFRLNRYQLAPFSNRTQIRYKLTDGKLKELTPYFLPLYSLFTIQNIQTKVAFIKAKDRKKNFALFLAILNESYKIAKQHYPHAKFVILLYKDPHWHYPGRQLTTSEINQLNKAGFIVIDSEKLVGHELTSDKYRLSDKDHPNEQAWQEIAPLLVKRLNL